MRIHNPANKAGVVLYVPGLSANEEIIEALAGEAGRHGMATAVMDLWTDPASYASVTVASIGKELRECIEKLREEYGTAYAVGKSFGGGMLLAAGATPVERMVLWAPAIGVSEGESAGKDLINIPLSEVDSPLSLSVSTDELASFSSPVLILHGTEDTAVPLENSERIIASLPEAGLERMQGCKHSPKSEKDLRELIEQTFSYLISVSGDGARIG